MSVDYRELIIKTPLGEKPHYVYELLYPDGFVGDEGIDLTNVIFYIGKGKVTKSSIQRVDMHEYYALWSYDHQGWMEYPVTPTDHKTQTIQKIWKKGMSVKKRIALEADNDDEISRQEVKHIEQNISSYLENGTHNILNPHRWSATSRKNGIAANKQAQALAKKLVREKKEQEREEQWAREREMERRRNRGYYIRVRDALNQLRYMTPEGESYLREQFEMLDKEFGEEVKEMEQRQKEAPVSDTASWD